MDRSEAGKLGYAKTKNAIDQYLKAKSQRCRDEYQANPKCCLFCGNLIPFQKRRSKFCDKSCSASYNNRGVTRHIKGSKVCQCGNPKKPHNKYCDECSKNHVYHKALTLEDAKTEKTRRKVLLAQRGHRCEGCGLTEWRQRPIPLDVHHIDGNTDNNTDENLQLLCPNCHAQTPTFRRRNVRKDGARQRMRRKRYANGQTW